MDYDSYDSASEIAYSEVSGDSGDYGFDGGSDDQPRARQVRTQCFGTLTGTNENTGRKAKF